MKCKCLKRERSILVFLALVNEERVKNIALKWLDNVLETWHKQIQVLVYDERIDDDGCLESLLFSRSFSRFSWLCIFPLNDLGGVVLHFHDYVLRVFVCVYSLVENLDNTYRWEFTRVTI